MEPAMRAATAANAITCLRIVYLRFGSLRAPVLMGEREMYRVLTRAAVFGCGR